MTYPSNSGSVAQDQIKAFVERIERMDEELKAINDDKREIYAEAKGNGFDVGALKAVIKIRRQDHAERMEKEALIELYMSALESSPSRAPAPAREIIEEFPTPASGGDTGEPDSGAGPDLGPGLATKSTAARKDVPQSDELAGPVQNQDGGSLAPQNDPAGGTVEVSAGVESAGVGRVEQPVASPRSNGSQAGTQAPPVDTIPLRKQWKHSDPAHRDCQNPEQCGGLSNHGLCPKCEEAAA